MSVEDWTDWSTPKDGPSRRFEHHSGFYIGRYWRLSLDQWVLRNTEGHCHFIPGYEDHSWPTTTSFEDMREEAEFMIRVATAMAI